MCYDDSSTSTVLARVRWPGDDTVLYHDFSQESIVLSSSGACTVADDGMDTVRVVFCVCVSLFLSPFCAVLLAIMDGGLSRLRHCARKQSVQNGGRAR